MSLPDAVTSLSDHSRDFKQGQSHFLDRERLLSLLRPTVSLLLGVGWGGGGSIHLYLLPGQARGAGPPSLTLRGGVGAARGLADPLVGD